MVICGALPPLVRFYPSLGTLTALSASGVEGPGCIYKNPLTPGGFSWTSRQRRKKIKALLSLHTIPVGGGNDEIRCSKTCS